jgi:bifunctional non-homologous end joining protein LigD
MLRKTSRDPSDFVGPCQPSRVARPPSGPFWIHEIKHDGYRLMVHRVGSRIRCFTRNGREWGDRFPAIVLAARRLKVESFVIDGEVVVLREDGRPDFNALRGKRRNDAAVLLAFDLLECRGKDLRKTPQWRLCRSTIPRSPSVDRITGMALEDRLDHCIRRGE